MMNLIAFLFLFLFSTALSSPTPPCNSTCGPHHLPYPFGFSSGCPITLTCSHPNSTIFLPNSTLPIRSFSSNTILISLKPDCTRSVDQVNLLFSTNYLPTSRNALLLRNCTSVRSFPNCSISELETSFQLRDFCGIESSDLICYAGEGGGGFMEFGGVNGSGCGSVFSAIWTEGNRSAGNETAIEVGDAVVELEVDVVELRWWMDGGCGGGRCSIGADCYEEALPENRLGFRCGCKDGFVGDGFLDGVGCHRVSTSCNTTKYISRKCNGLTKDNILIAGVAAGTLLALLSMASLCLCIHRKRQMTKFRKIDRHQLSESDTICIPIYSYKEILRATNCFSDENYLGTGAYGTVYQAKLQDFEYVAVKRIKNRESSESIEQVINEIKLLSSVNHPNLVHLLGCSIENIEEQILVYDFMPNGTLCQHLQRERGDGLTWPVRLSIVKETAQAIAYLHSAINPPIFHRDIKSSNILLDNNFKAKVADFGLSRFGLPESSFISTAPQGTPGYLDPQYHQSFHLSDKSDVYSFGVVLAEIMTGLKVVDFSRQTNEVNLAAFATDKIGKGCIEEILDPLLKQEILDPWTSTSIHKVAELAFRCLAYHQDMRPSMVEVVAELEHLGPNKVNASSLFMGGMPQSPSPEADTGLVVQKPRSGSLGFFMFQDEPSCESSMEDGSRLSTHELWSSQHSSPSSNSLLANR